MPTLIRWYSGEGTPVDSSTIAAIGYVSFSETLDIEFHNEAEKMEPASE